MLSLTVLYEPPEDPVAFMRHYTEIHLPLARAVPGVSKLLASKVVSSPTSKSPPYFLVAEMQFASEADFNAAMSSPENKAAGRDLANFAKGRFKMVVTSPV
jgi:uncharacterized protein (TIGR02118 family)